MVKKRQVIGLGGPFTEVLPATVIAQRAPTSNDTNFSEGQDWLDNSVSPPVLYLYLGGGAWQSNNLTLSTDGTFAGASNSTASSSLAIKTYVDAVASFGAPIANNVTQGIGYVADNAQAVARQANTDGVESFFLTPTNLDAILAAPSAIGSTTASSGAFTGLTADGSGTVSLVSNAAALFDVTGAGNDLTLSSDAGRVVVNGEEAAADAVRILSAAGGLDVDVALQMSLVSSQNAADAIVINASAGGIDITAAGAAAEDIDITNTAGSIRLVAGENVADSIVLSSSIGGIDILAASASAGEDIDIIATGSSVNINSTENVSDSIVISSTNGGIDILALGAAAGEDIDITATGSSIRLTSTENVTDAINIEATLGGINILASGAAAGEDINLTATGSSINLSSTENAALAISLNSNGNARILSSQ